MINEENTPFTKFIQAINIGVMALGLLVMLGWVFDISVLKSIVPGFSTMKFNTALSFLLIAASIFFQVFDSPTRRLLWKIPGGLVLTVGLLSLSEELIKNDLGIDQLLFPNEGYTEEPTNPVRMAAATALCFILIGLFTVTLGSKKRGIVLASQAGLHTVTLIAFTAILGYILDVSPIYKHWFITSMAVHTSVCFLLISISSSLINPKVGLAELFTGQGIGNIMARRLFIQMIVATVFLAYLRVISERYELVTVDFGIALLALSFILVSLVLIRSNARALNVMESKKSQAESSLQQTSMILDSTPDPMIIIDESGFILLANSQTTNVFGYSKDELIGEKVELLIPQRFKSQHGAHRTSFFTAPKSRMMGSGLELFASRKDGTEIPVEVSLNPIHVEEKTWVSAAIRDVSERKQEETKLNQLGSIINSSADAIISKKPDGTILTWNPAAESILGYSAEEVVGKNVSILYPPDLMDEEEIMISLITKGETVSQYETKRLRKDKKIIHVSITLSPIKNNRGEISAISAILRDISAQKQEEAEKHRVQEVLDRTNEIARIGTWEVDLVNNTVYWSKITKEIHEVPQDYVPELAKGIEFYKEGKSRETIQKVIGEAMEAGKKFDVELQIVTAKSKTIWVRAIGQPEFSSGKCVRLYGIFQDIDEITKSRETLHTRNQELQAILNAGHVSIIRTDTSGVITHFNKGAEKLLQYSATEMIGKHTPAIIHAEHEVVQRGQELSEIYGEEIMGFEVFVRKARDGKYESREWTYVRKDGSTFPVQLVVTAIRDESGKITGFLGIATDITERKQAEEKMRNYSILESKSKEMEQFAYVASHDLREPLLTIINYMDLLLEDYGDKFDGDGKRFTNAITRAAGRMDELIKGLLDYSRLSSVKDLEEADVNKIIKASLADLNNLIVSKKASITYDRLPTINAYPLEIKLLFQNLITNAIKFARKGEKPKIHISAVQIDNGWQFSVRDNGIGIEEKDHEKIFFMFQRGHGKTEFEGTGIGLAHCKKIVELHNGKIWIESVSGEYSTFHFTILT